MTQLNYSITKLLNSPITQSSSFLPVKIDEQIMVLVYPHPVQFGVGQLGREALPDRDGQVFGGGNAGEKFGDFFVQETVVHGVEHFAVHGFIELLEVNHEPR